MHIHRTDRFGFPILQLTGDLDFSTFGPLLSALRRAAEIRPRRIALDMGEVVRVDHTGMSFLLTVAEWLAGQQCHLRIIGVSAGLSAAIRELNRHLARGDTVQGRVQLWLEGKAA